MRSAKWPKSGVAKLLAAIDDGVLSRDMVMAMTIVWVVRSNRIGSPKKRRILEPTSLARTVFLEDIKTDVWGSVHRRRTLNAVLVLNEHFQFP